MSDRIALHRLTQDQPHLPAEGLVRADEYSRFKHGDGAASTLYGRALAETFHGIVRPEPGERIVVTSSGYGAVPPAARSLVRPFIARMQVLAPQVDFSALRVHRLGVTPGDYATMSAADRESAVGAKSMHVDPRVDIAGTRVVSLDDIRVTGTHELAMDACLVEAGSSWVDHLYIVDAHACAAEPTLESVLNGASVRSVDDLISLTRARQFAPNARFAKRVLTMSRAEQVRFVQNAAPAVTRWVVEAGRRDGLAHVPAYATGVRRMDVVVAALASRASTA